MSKTYNLDRPPTGFDDDEIVSLTGETMNGIGNFILELKNEIDDLEQKIKHGEESNLLKELNELRLRDRNPTLKDAWDQYQTVLKLVEEKE